MLVIQNGRIHTITNGIIERGSILIQDGKIAAIGTDVPVPAGAEVFDAEGRMVMPGIIEAHSHLGVAEADIGAMGQDYNEGTEPCTPHVRAIDGINPRETGLRDAYQNGVTAAWMTPGSANPIGGQGAFCHTYGATIDEMVINPYAGLKGALGENPKNYHKGKVATRMGSAAVIRDLFYKAKAYMKKQEAARAKGEEIDYDMRLEPVCAVLRKEVPMRMHAHRSDDIMTALRLAREFDYDLIVEHCSEGHLIVDELANDPHVKAVCVGPTLMHRSKAESIGKTWITGGITAKAGILTALITDHPVIPVQYLPIVAAYAAKNGMGEEEALKAITINPAKICGVADRMGSLEVGKDADIAIFTTHPFDSWKNECVATIIGGKIIYKNPKF